MQSWDLENMFLLKHLYVVKRHWVKNRDKVFETEIMLHVHYDIYNIQVT